MLIGQQLFLSDLPTAAGLVIFSIFFIEEQVEAQLEAHELASDAAAGLGTTAQAGTNPAVLNPVGTATSTDYNVGQGTVSYTHLRAHET